MEKQTLLNRLFNIGAGLCLAVSSQISFAKDSVNNVICKDNGNEKVCVIKKLEEDDSFPNWKLVFPNGSHIDPNKITTDDLCIYYDGNKIICKNK